jgi:hypothetical protein
MTGPIAELAEQRTARDRLRQAHGSWKAAKDALAKAQEAEERGREILARAKEALAEVEAEVEEKVEARAAAIAERGQEPADDGLLQRQERARWHLGQAHRTLVTLKAAREEAKADERRPQEVVILAAEALLGEEAERLAAETQRAEMEALIRRRSLAGLAQVWLSEAGKPRPIKLPALVKRVLAGPAAQPQSPGADPGLLAGKWKRALFLLVEVPDTDVEDLLR